MSNMNKYFSFPNSSINTFKESFNKFLNDTRNTSLRNELSNPDFKQLFNSIPYNWNIDGNNITFNTSTPFSTITFIETDTTISQNIASKLKPDTEYSISFEFDSTDSLEFSVQYLGTGLINLINNNTTTLITQTFIEEQTRNRAFIYFKTPSFITNTLNFIITNKGTNNTITVYSLCCNQGMVEFFNMIPKDFWNESSKFEEGHWRVTEDGTIFRRLLFDGDNESILINENLKDDLNNVYYTVHVNDKTLYLKASIIIINENMYLVNDKFADAYNNYVKNHTNRVDVYDGIHKILDSRTGRKYTFAIDDTDSIVLIENPLQSTINLGAENFYLSFNKEHSVGGEHIFKSLSTNEYDKKIELIYNNVDGTHIIHGVPMTKIPILITDDHSYIGNYYFNNTNNMYHDEDGNHVIKDTDNRNWSLEIVSGELKFTPIMSSIITDELYESFKLEHDIYGRHVFRDISTGMFYIMKISNGEFFYERTNFHPITSKQQILDAFKLEHDMNGYHLLYDPVTNTYHRFNVVNGNLDSILSVDTYRQFHHDNIATAFLTHHYIQTSNSSLKCHKVLDGIVYRTFQLDNKRLLLESM